MTKVVLPPVKPPQQVTIAAVAHTLLEMDARRRGLSFDAYLDLVIRGGLFVEAQREKGYEILVRIGDDVRAVEWTP